MSYSTGSVLKTRRFEIYKAFTYEKILFAFCYCSLQESVPISVRDFFVHVNATVVRNLILNFVSWRVSDLWVVGIVSCVVCVTLVVVVDWLVVGIMVDVVVHVVDIVVHISVDVGIVVMVIDVVGWLSDHWLAVVVVSVTSDDWVDGVLLGVLVLSGVGIFVVLGMSVVSAGWLSVGVLLDINNIVMVWVVWVVRVSS